MSFLICLTVLSSITFPPTANSRVTIEQTSHECVPATETTGTLEDTVTWINGEMRKYHLSLGNSPRVRDFVICNAQTITDPTVNVLFDNKNSVIFEGQLRGQVTADGNYKTFIFKSTPTDSAVVNTETYATLYFEKGLKGTVNARSYTTIIVDGSMEGTIVCCSYVDILINGTFGGEIKRLRHDNLHFADGTITRGRGRIDCRVGLKGVVAPTIIVHGSSDIEDILSLITVTYDRRTKVMVEELRQECPSANTSIFVAPVTVECDECDLETGKSGSRRIGDVLVEYNMR